MTTAVVCDFLQEFLIKTGNHLATLSASTLTAAEQQIASNPHWDGCDFFAVDVLENQPSLDGAASRAKTNKESFSNAPG